MAQPVSEASPEDPTEASLHLHRPVSVGLQHVGVRRRLPQTRAWQGFGVGDRETNQSILKEISPGISLEGMMLKLKLQYFGHLMRRVDSLDSAVSNSVRPHGQQPTRLLCPWDSPGKNTGVGCHFFLTAWGQVPALKFISCVTLSKSIEVSELQFSNL